MDFKAYLSTHDLKKAIRALKSSNEMSSLGFELEFRPERPTMHSPLVVYGSKTRKRPLADDISERLSMAVAAMQEARRSRPLAAVADALAESGLLPKGQTSTSHVMSRRKAYGALAPLEGPVASAWMQSYYSVLHIKEHGKSPGELERPDRFVFMKCDC